MDLSKVKRLLIIRLSSLGDILLATPVIRSLKRSYPLIEIDFLLKEQYRDLLKLNPHLTNLFIYSQADSGNMIKQLKDRNYDLIVDLQKNFRSSSVLRGLQSKVMRFNKRSLDKFLLVKFKINRLENAPPIPERYASVIPDFHLDNEGLELHTNKISSIIPTDKRRYAGFAPGARHFTKRWPKEYYAALGHLLKNKGYTVLLFGGTEDRTLCKELSEVIQDSIDLCTNNDILQTAADMKLCRVVICNDSGLMHTACAAGIPVLSIFGSTVKEFGFTPYNSKSLVLENKSLSCRPCSHIGKSRCPQGHFKCMLDITPKEVYSKLMDLLS